jgi:hypothetical protein
METKKTAVEWLYENLPLLPYTIKDFEYNEEILRQAKEMEKEQIMDAYLIGLAFLIEMKATIQAEQYYNETYKQKENA